MPTFEPISDADIKLLQAQSDDVYRNKLTKGSRGTEKGVLDDYTDGLHNALNPYLYGKLNAPPAAMAKYARDVDLMDSAMDKFSLDKDVVVYSGTKVKHYAGWRVGDVKRIDAYLSTSAKEKPFAKTFYNAVNKEYKKTGDALDKPLMLEIRVPAGTKSIYVGDNTGYSKKETELILGRGLNYKVVEIKGDRMILEVMK